MLKADLWSGGLCRYPRGPTKTDHSYANPETEKNSVKVF